MIHCPGVKPDPEQYQLALEQAAKYICSIQCGKCPMAVNGSPCLEVCGSESRPWKCWISYFLQACSNAGAAKRDTEKDDLPAPLTA